eukprot:214233-Pyramimonas_sp.AAC.1
MTRFIATVVADYLDDNLAAAGKPIALEPPAPHPEEGTKSAMGYTIVALACAASVRTPIEQSPWGGAFLSKFRQPARGTPRFLSQATRLSAQ